MIAPTPPRLHTLWHSTIPAFAWEKEHHKGHRHGFTLDVVTTTEGLTIAFVARQTGAGWALYARRQWGGTTDVHVTAAKQWAEDQADAATRALLDAPCDPPLATSSPETAA